MLIGPSWTTYSENEHISIMTKGDCIHNTIHAPGCIHIQVSTCTNFSLTYTCPPCPHVYHTHIHQIYTTNTHRHMCKHAKIKNITLELISLFTFCLAFYSGMFTCITELHDSRSNHFILLQILNSRTCQDLKNTLSLYTQTSSTVAVL